MPLALKEMVPEATTGVPVALEEISNSSELNVTVPALAVLLQTLPVLNANQEPWVPVDGAVPADNVARIQYELPMLVVVGVYQAVGGAVEVSDTLDA
jgi:hypothetical protein